KPVDAHRNCDHEKCNGKVTLWYKGEDVLRVTARKDQFGEVEEFICNTCRFEKKKTSDWTIEKPTQIDESSVISSNHYDTFKPLPVIQENTALQEANKVQLERSIKI
ncbi:MAG: Fe-S-binding domain-containing protein, partial [Sphingobacteriaceae bacterium]|nr:Fe-S-binding domain-containing protein [Sphingobacteriaceae bacterium]